MHFWNNFKDFFIQTHLFFFVPVVLISASSILFIFSNFLSFFRFFLTLHFRSSIWRKALFFYIRWHQHHSLKITLNEITFTISCLLIIALSKHLDITYSNAFFHCISHIGREFQLPFRYFLFKSYLHLFSVELRSIELQFLQN